MIKIEKKAACCGCEACVQRCPSSCVEMRMDNEGFLYPFVDTKACINCGVCEQVCPAIHQRDERNPLLTFAAKNPDEEIRRQSSSGGIFTMFAKNVLSEGGIVFGAGFDERWEVVHGFAEDIDGLSKLRGSKYAQSRVGNTYRKTEDFLKLGRKVLFTGTPCQVAGLKSFLRKEYENLFTVDFVCHGVPSPKVWQLYLKELMNSPKGFIRKNMVLHSLDETPVSIGVSFRDKELGWKKYGFVVRKFTQNDGIDKNTVLFSETFHNNLFMKGFLNDLYLRPSCHACPAKRFKSGSDVTIGDFWGIQHVLPEFDDDRGVSAVVVNTEKGKELWQACGAIQVEVTYHEILRGNSVIEKSVPEPAKRTDFYREIDNCNIMILLKKHTRMPASFYLYTALKKTGLLPIVKFILRK